MLYRWKAGALDTLCDKHRRDGVVMRLSARAYVE